MREKLYRIFVSLGTVLILSALFLCLYNIKQNNDAYEISQNVLEELKKAVPEPDTAENFVYIPEVKQDDLFEPYEEQSPSEPLLTAVELDGKYYCGYISMPSIDIELPVLINWSYENLKIAPCCYSGSPNTHNFVIIAHNYNSHFGKLKYLNSDDEIIFTSCSGESYTYTVVNTEYVNGYDFEQMFSGQQNDWDLTLFTCTLDGQSRVTVRAVQKQQ